MITRRLALQGLLGAVGIAPRSLLAATPAANQTLPSPEAAALRIAATWRGAARDAPFYVGVIAFSAAQGMRIVWSERLPGRAHGLTALADGSLAVMAVRPGTWMQRYSAEGTRLANLQLPAAAPRHFTGHALAATNAEHLYTGETDPRDDSGWITVRDAATLQPLAQWPTHGIEPHDLTLGSDGQVWVANGGIRRAAGDAKRELERMDSSLVRLNATTGALTGQWRVDDPRLSLRHLAWSESVDGQPLLGIGIQAEHDRIEQRQEAPVLATWVGDRLTIPSYMASAAGYAGDICSAPEGGFVLTNHKVNAAFLWQPSAPARLTTMAQLTEAYALSSVQQQSHTTAALIAAARGAALWHPARPAVLLPWPMPMAPDNHWRALVG